MIEIILYLSRDKYLLNVFIKQFFIIVPILQFKFDYNKFKKIGLRRDYNEYFKIIIFILNEDQNCQGRNFFNLFKKIYYKMLV